MSDTGISYRDNDEVQEYRTQFDAIRMVTSWILENKWLTEDEVKIIEWRGN